MTKLRKVLGGCAFVLLSWQWSSALAAPQSGWWGNPAEPGRRFFIESQNGITFLGSYFYDDNGHATWLVSGGPNSDPYSYTGQLYTFGKGETLFGDYVAPSDPVDAGVVSVTFSDDTHGTLSWPDGTVAIERVIFGATDAVFQPFTFAALRRPQRP